MPEKINVAVFPCGSEVGLEIHRALKYYRHFYLIGISSVSDHGRIVYNDYVGKIPFLKEKNFISELKKTIEEKKIHFLIPAMDEAGYYLKKNEESLGCEIVYPELRIANIIRKKSDTYEALKDVIKTPKVYKNLSEAKQNLPLFIKPDIGYGSRGARKIENIEDVEYFSGTMDEYIVMENLPGKEYTIDCLSNNNGDILFSGARVRERVRMGISVSTQTVKNKKLFASIAKKIGQALKLKGIWFFQLKEDKKGELTLLEVAGRVSGSMALYRGLGVNFIASELFQRLGAEIEIPKLINEHALLERSFDCKIEMNLTFDTVYCDLDDCLIINGRVNEQMVAFLYQCLNKGKKLILITRHDVDPQKTLNNLRLAQLFDEIRHIKNRNISKTTEIRGSNGIFIDDSFEERKDVAEACGIPTFAPDGIELIAENVRFK